MAQRLIERACDRFRKEVSPEDASEIVSTESIDDVKLALEQVERHLAARGSLRNFDRIAPFLGAAERLSQVVEVVCNGTPYLPWIWAPVKFIVQSARDHAHVLDKVLMAYANIGNNMPRLSRYGEVFDDHAFQYMIAYLFEDILEFHGKAYSMLKKPGWTIFFSSAWGRFDHRFSSLLTNIERLSEQIDREAVALDIMATIEWRSKNAEDASKREEQWQTQQLHATMNWLCVENDIQESKLEMNANKCYEGTCQWLTKSSKIRTWLQRKRGSSVLWLNGKPGSGKSIMSSMLIRFLRSDPSRRVCFFFCDYNTSPLDIGTQVLRTMCSQMIRMAPDLVPYIYEECLGKAQISSSDVLKRIMPQLFSRFDDVNLVVDGIDELPSSEHRNLIRNLLQLSAASSGLKLLLVSQDLPTISTHLSKRPTLWLREEIEATRKDHTIMVEGSLKELNEDRNGAIGDVLMEKLKNDILEKSEGMFLWVNLVMNLLRMSKSRQELLQQINSLPKSLADIYQKILNNICHQRTSSSAADIMRIFSWLKCHKGKQPMLKCEVRLGMALDGATRKITRDSLPWADATDICKPLIEDGPGNTLVFVYSTVPQFLFERGANSFMSVPEGIATVTFACICQINQALGVIRPHDPTSTSTIEVACGLYGLLPYSCQYWTQHLIDFLALSEQVTTNFSAIIIECLKRLCQKLMGMTDTDLVAIGTDETSLLLQKFLTVAEAAVLTPMINRDKQSLSPGVEPVTTKLDAPSASLQEYRRTVQHVIQQSSIPGVEQYELIAFKEDYGPTAFVCDWPGCNSMLRGFPTKIQLSSHRAQHTHKLQCDEKDCPRNDVGFTTQSSLKQHKRKMHPDVNTEPIPKRFQRKMSTMMHNADSGQQAGEMAAENLASSFHEPTNGQIHVNQTAAGSQEPAVRGSPTLQQERMYNRNRAMAIMLRHLGLDQQQTLRLLPPEKQDEVLDKWDPDQLRAFVVLPLEKQKEAFDKWLKANYPSLRPMQQAATKESNTMHPGQGIPNRNNLMAVMMRNLGRDQQQTLRMLPPDKQNEVLDKWLAANNRQQMANQPQADNMPGVNAQNPTLMEQHSNPMRPSAPGQPSIPAFMDAVDLPPAVVAQIPQLPPAIKEWGQLKQWMIQNNANPVAQNKILSLQQMQYQRMDIAQRAQAGGRAHLPPGTQPQDSQGQMGSQVQPLNANATIQLALQNVTISPQEIQSARQSGKKFKGWNEEDVRRYLLQVKEDQLRRELMRPRTANNANSDR